MDDNSLPRYVSSINGRDTQVTMATVPTVERIADRRINDTCECGGSAAYVVHGKRLCIVAAQSAAPEVVPALPQGEMVVIRLQPVGGESMTDQARLSCLARRRQALSCSTVYRILPNTGEYPHAWLRPGLAATHGYSLSKALLDIRESFVDYKREFSGADLVVIDNYGWSVWVPYSD